MDVYEDVETNTDCVTIINVTSNPHQTKSRSTTPDNHSSQPTTDFSTSTSSSDRGSFTINSITRNHSSDCRCKTGQYDPTYENLEFHQVKINIPGNNLSRKRSQKLRESLNPSNNVVKRRVFKNKPPKCVNKNISAESAEEKFEKFGYSKTEVWNWLYAEQAGNAVTGSTGNTGNIKDIYSVPQKLKSICNGINKAEDEFTKTADDFLNASNRLAHLDLEGFEAFVGNTLEKALLKRRKKKCICGNCELCESKLILDNCDMYQPVNNNNNNKKCENCSNGESSCSSALSSLESNRSSNNFNLIINSGNRLISEDSSTLQSVTSKSYQTLEAFGNYNGKICNL